MGVPFRIGFFFIVLFIESVGPCFAEQPADTRALRATPHIQNAVEFIGKQVDWFGKEPSGYSREFLCAISTMNYVQSRVSPLEYALLVRDRRTLPAGPEEYLSTGAGICGGQVMTASEILTHLGIRNRSVEFYLPGTLPAENRSHIGLEVFYTDGWHFFDVTWGTFFRADGAKTDEVLPIDEVLKARDALEMAVTNESDLWYQQWKAAGLDPFEYITAPGKDVIVGREGTIHLRPSANAGQRQVYKPTHQPNYIGRNSAAADSGSLSFRLLAIRPECRRCTISIIGVAGTGRLTIQSKAGRTVVPLSDLTAGDHEIDLAGLAGSDSFLIEVVTDGPSEIGYVVINQFIIN